MSNPEEYSHIQPEYIIYPKGWPHYDDHEKYEFFSVGDDLYYSGNNLLKAAKDVYREFEHLPMVYRFEFESGLEISIGEEKSLRISPKGEYIPLSVITVQRHNNPAHPEGERLVLRGVGKPVNPEIEYKQISDMPQPIEYEVRRLRWSKIRESHNIPVVALQDINLRIFKPRNALKVMLHYSHLLSDSGRPIAVQVVRSNAILKKTLIEDFPRKTIVRSIDVTPNEPST